VDEVGLRLAGAGRGWLQRRDMDAASTRPLRGSMVGRARFIEDHVIDQAGRGIGQYVILGSGLDSFALRRLEIAAGMRVFEIDRPGSIAWKRQRLIDLGYGIPPWLRLVPVDFEAGGSWREELQAAGFDAARPAVVASAGVSMYLQKETTVATLRQVAALAPGSSLVMTFIQPLGQPEPEIFISLFSAPEMLGLARDAGFADARFISTPEVVERYFAGRADGLQPRPSQGLLVAMV
jgi:methyltransferase (TIGR00027 family)